MKISYVSTQATSNSLRQNIRQLQNDILRRQQEVSSGRLADYGRTLGTRSGELTGTKLTLDRLSTIIDTNALAGSRLEVTQHGIGQIRAYTEQLMTAMTAGMSQELGRAAVLETAKQTLLGIEDVINLGFNGQNVFGGINTDGKVTDGFANSPAKAAFDTAFQTYFGFTKDDPAAGYIDATAMRDFLDTVVTPQFFGSDWSTNYSNATDNGIVSRITLTQMQVTSFSANEDGFRGAVMAAAIASELFDSAVGQAALVTVAEKAIELGGQANADLADVQGRAGVSQEQLSRASVRLEAQYSLLEERIAGLENIDQFEASTSLSGLLTQLEISFSLTTRIQQLSIMNYLS
ncbi:MAG: flagellar hook-associated family protein [Brucellaceae bacterium]|nr:flagellar hook-associated family protein [Brucellaceae bacterium]